MIDCVGFEQELMADLIGMRTALAFAINASTSVIHLEIYRLTLAKGVKSAKGRK